MALLSGAASVLPQNRELVDHQCQEGRNTLKTARKAHGLFGSGAKVTGVDSEKSDAIRMESA